jgi:hypothetical protein
MRRIGATCTAAQPHMRCKCIPSQEYDQTREESVGGDALPSEWRPCASRRPIACIAAGGSARFRLITCSPAISAREVRQNMRDFRQHERQAPIIRPATEGGDCEAGWGAEKGKSGGRRYEWVPATEARSFCTEDPAGRVAPATGEYRMQRGERGEGARHPASAQKSQHKLPAQALRAVGRGVGQPEPLAPAFQVSPSVV